MTAIDKLAPLTAILDHIAANPGCGRGQIAAYTGIAPQQLTRELTKLHRAGKISKAGDKRGATYTIRQERT